MTTKLLSAASVLLLIGCSSTDKFVAPVEPTITVCHFTGAVGTITDIPLSELTLRRVSGDYVTNLVVDKTLPDGDGIHFKRITDALGAAKSIRAKLGETDASSCRITITVAAGTVSGSASSSADPTAELFPLVIDVPAITLRGALNMHLDASDRATGSGETSAATTFTPNPRLVVNGPGSQAGVSQEIIVVDGHPDGSSGNGAVIEGFVFQNGHADNDSTLGGQAILTMRVKDLVIRGNKFETGFTEWVDMRATSATVTNNYMSGSTGSCDLCLAGPGDFMVSGNRLASGGIDGIVAMPAAVLPVPSQVEQYVPGATSQTSAVITNNEVRSHLRTPVGVGIRIGAVGVGAPNVAGKLTATITRNTLIGNTFGMIIEAAFPVAGSLLHGDLDVTTSTNTISQSCQSDLLVTLTRHTTALGINNRPYLKNSTYSLHFDASDSALAWDKAWFSDPAGFGNILIVNGQTIPNGASLAYDPNKVCP